MTRVQLEMDPYTNDPTRWATSMMHHAELLLPALDAAGVRSVVEVGAFAGDLTRLLVSWASASGASVTAIDPSPRNELLELEKEHSNLELIRETSLGALARIDLPDAVVIDGDHNYYTVSEELLLIERRAAETDAGLPLLLFHDVAWPHARRDDYFAPEQIPEHYRQPLAGEGRGIYPGDPGLRTNGLPYPRSAAHEGGPRNGVLTALEDFVTAREDLCCAVVPAFFGFGVAWRRAAPWSEDVSQLLAPWDNNTVVGRLENNRVHHLAESHARQLQIWKLQERQARQEAVLRRLLESKAFSIAERLSRMRVRAGIAPAQSVISKDEVRRSLAD